MKQLLGVAPSWPPGIMENTAPCGIGGKAHIDGRRQGAGKPDGDGADRDGGGDGGGTWTDGGGAVC